MIKLPYHKGFIEFDETGENIAGVLISRAHEYYPGLGESELVEHALDNPIGSGKLENLIINKKSMTIITSDHTRPVPSGITLPIILRRVREANPKIDIKIFIATGTHRSMTREEIREKFGAEIAGNEKIIIHDARDDKNMVSLGRLDTGLNAEVNKKIVETDFLMAEGFIEPHFFAGFSGGRKSVFPGAASLKCVMANHCAEYIQNPNARAGVLKDNPIHAEALEMAERAGLRFILNVAIDSEKKIIAAFAGHFDTAHAAGCKFVEGLSAVAPAPADIVITTNGGYPMDRNIYQAVKSMTAAEASCKKNGVIIVAAGCRDGHGGDGFYDTFLNADSPAEAAKKILSRSRSETVEDQWQSQIFARVLKKHTVILVTDLKNKKTAEEMFMIHAASIGDALDIAKKKLRAAEPGREPIAGPSITIIPDGVSVIVKKPFDKNADP